MVRLGLRLRLGLGQRSVKSGPQKFPIRPATFLGMFNVLTIWCKSINTFLRCFWDPMRVPRIENRVPRHRENYHRVPNRENRVPMCPYQVPNIFLKKNELI